MYHDVSGRVTALVTALAVLASLVAGAAGASAQAGSSTTSPGGQAAIAQVADAVPGEYIVTLRDDAVALPQVAGVAAQLVTDNGGEILFTYKSALRGFAASMSEADATALAADPRVAAVQQNGIVHALGAQQDPPSWGLDRIDQRELPLDNGYSFPDDESGAGVTAYIIDTGIRTTHVALGGRATVGFDAIGDGQNGQDCHGHGTHVAGTVGSEAYGVAKEVALVAVRVLNCEGSGTDAQVIAGMDWVAANAAHPAVANMSLGGGVDPATDAAVANLTAAGVTVAVAAGNGDLIGRPVDACTGSPARAPEAITIGATDIADQRADFSNFGTCVDLFAPGVGITSSLGTSDDGVATWNGTSMATPHVAGVAARYLSLDPTATPAQVTAAILTAATPDKVGDPRAGSPNRLLNTSFALPTPSITTVVDATPDAAKDFPFELCPVAPTGGSCRTFTLDDDANPALGNRDRIARIAPGTYTVTQGEVTGWGLSAIACDGDQQTSRRDRRATITVGPDDAVTCTFQNATSALTIVEDSLPDAARDFRFRRCGATRESCVDFRLDDDDDATLTNRRLFARVAPGTYTVTQAAASKWSLADLACDRGSAQVDRPNRRVVVTVRRNKSTTCTFTNATTAISVVQDTTPIDGADFGYALCPQGPQGPSGLSEREEGVDTCRHFVLDDDHDAARSNRNAVTGLTAGTHTVTQDPSHGPLTAITCDGGSTTDVPARRATVTIVPGDRVVCTFANTAPGPDNDFFADATVLSGPTGTVAGTTSRSTLEPGEPTHTGDSTHSVWYAWTAPASGQVTFDTCDASAYDTTLDAYSGTVVGSLTVQAQNDDACDVLSSEITFNAVSGTTYHVAVGGYHDDSGRFNLHWVQS